MAFKLEMEKLNDYKQALTERIRGVSDEFLMAQLMEELEMDVEPRLEQLQKKVVQEEQERLNQLALEELKKTFRVCNNLLECINVNNKMDITDLLKEKRMRLEMKFNHKTLSDLCRTFGICIVIKNMYKKILNIVGNQRLDCEYWKIYVDTTEKDWNGRYESYNLLVKNGTN